jgi:dienelactone hydrolase
MTQIVQVRRALFPRLFGMATVCTAAAGFGADYREMRDQVDSLAQLSEVPAVFPVEGRQKDAVLRPLFFESVPWHGRPTRVFAWLGVPAADEPVPGVVLVHGGGGTAFTEWVRRWNDRGFAAIAIAVEGQTDEPAGDGGESRWRRHAFGGPSRQGIYGDTGEPLEDQWMFHAVSATILANSLLRSLPGVASENVGIAGISWGGVIATTVIGLDDRLAFAIPVYACGDLASIENQYGRSLQRNEIFRQVLDPMLRIHRARTPVLWLSWPGDLHFPLDCLSDTYRKYPGPKSMALVPGLGHGHQPAWTTPESYAFAESIVSTGRPWLEQIEVLAGEGLVAAEFESTRRIEKASLIWTSGHGLTGQRIWNEARAQVETSGTTATVSADLPEGVTAWFINVTSDGLTGSSTVIFQDPPDAP